MAVPANPKIYHITHVDNLASIIREGCLWSDTVMVERQGARVIGNREIKADRLWLPVDCHPGTTVGQYVPFYLCPRSVMLYIISRRDHPNVAFRDGQGPVVHLMADMKEVVAWASDANARWAFTDINAANRAADFFNDLSKLDKLNWDAIQASSWRSCRDHKMAEFLLHQRFPWELVRGIGVQSPKIAQQVAQACSTTTHRPLIRVKQEWYY